MKTLSSLLLTLAIALTLSMPAFASSCPKIMKEIDAKVVSMKVMGDKAAKINALRVKGEQLHKEGKHAESVATLNEALAMLK
jgi:hypothetical protein